MTQRNLIYHSVSHDNLRKKVRGLLPLQTLHYGCGNGHLLGEEGLAHGHITDALVDAVLCLLSIFCDGPLFSIDPIRTFMLLSALA